MKTKTRGKEIEASSPSGKLWNKIKTRSAHPAAPIKPPHRKGLMIRTDFSKVERLLLVYPENMREGQYDYHVLAPFYDELIALVPEDIHVIVFVTSRRTGDRLKEVMDNLEYVVHESLSTIWLRDVAGFNCGDRIVKPTFRPQYYRGAFRRAHRIDRNMECISAILGKDLYRIPLCWDGGNLVTNGTVGVVTERLLRDNPSFSLETICGLIREHLRIEPLLVPELQGDSLAHSDGYLAFLNERTVLVSEYLETVSAKDRVYVDRLTEMLSSTGFQIERIKENPIPVSRSPDPAKTSIPSARGIYVNYLQLNETFIVPEYSFDYPCEGVDYNEANRSFLSRFGQVKTINSDALAHLGGVLHCISFTD